MKELYTIVSFKNGGKRDLEICQEMNIKRGLN
jgi:hypothetical protein